MPKSILIIQGHPDATTPHFCHALADAYADGATGAGHAVRRIAVAELDFPLLRTRADWENGAPPPAIAACQEDIRWAEHIVFVFPLWLGDLPALLKGFLEQALRPGFALGKGPRGFSGGLLKGRSARIVVTMGMPALFYRWYFRAHSLKSFEHNILAFCGVRPVRDTVVGLVESGGEARHRQWLDKMRELGQRAV